MGRRPRLPRIRHGGRRQTFVERCLDNFAGVGDGALARTLREIGDDGASVVDVEGAATSSPTSPRKSYFADATTLRTSFWNLHGKFSRSARLCRQHPPRCQPTEMRDGASSSRARSCRLADLAAGDVEGVEWRVVFFGSATCAQQARSSDGPRVHRCPRPTSTERRKVVLAPRAAGVRRVGPRRRAAAAVVRKSV